MTLELVFIIIIAFRNHQMAKRLVVYEDSPKYDLWFKILLGSIPVGLLILGLLTYQGILPDETEAEAGEGAIILFASVTFFLLLYLMLLPRKYQILEDRLKVVLGGPFSFTINFNGVKTAEQVRGLAPIIGIDFTTSVDRVKIVRKGWGLNVLLSPGNRDLFLQNLDKALNDWRERHTYSL